MLIVMNNRTHEGHLSNHYKLKKKQFKRAITFLTCYFGIFEVTQKTNKFYFAK